MNQDNKYLIPKTNQKQIFKIKEFVNSIFSNLKIANKTQQNDKVYYVNFNQNVKKRYRFVRIFIEDKLDDTKINLAVPILFFPFAIFFKDNPNIIDISSKEHIVKIYLD